METWTNSKTIYEGKIFNVSIGEAKLDDGRIVQREVVQHNGGVGIVPVLDDRVILVRQFRIATGKDILEIPAGRLEGEETPKHRAACELEEEIGYRAGRLELVASCYCSPGFTNEMDHIFLAYDLELTEQRPESDEILERVELPIAQLDALIRERKIDDAKTLIGLRELLARM